MSRFPAPRSSLSSKPYSGSSVCSVHFRRTNQKRERSSSEWHLVRQGSPNGASYSSLGQRPRHHDVTMKALVPRRFRWVVGMKTEPRHVTPRPRSPAHRAQTCEASATSMTQKPPNYSARPSLLTRSIELACYWIRTACLRGLCAWAPDFLCDTTLDAE